MQGCIHLTSPRFDEVGGASHFYSCGMGTSPDGKNVYLATPGKLWRVDVDAAASAGPSGFDPAFAQRCIEGLGLIGGDAIHVRGTAGSVGDVNYTTWGLSGGSYSGGGFGFVTGRGVGRTGTPDNIQDVGVTFSLRGASVQTGITYEGTSNISGTGPLMWVSIYPDVSTPFVNCAEDGSGSGIIHFTRYGGTDPDNLVLGLYKYRCPSIGMDVQGCFRF